MGAKKQEFLTYLQQLARQLHQGPGIPGGGAPQLIMQLLHRLDGHVDGVGVHLLPEGREVRGRCNMAEHAALLKWSDLTACGAQSADNAIT